MPLNKKDAEKCLDLLWDYLPLSQAAEQRQAYSNAISSLHAYLTDVLPATQPCVRTRYPDGVVEIFLDQETSAQKVELVLSTGEKLGLVLDSVNVNGESNAASPIVISLLRPNSAAAKDGRLARGDQVLYVNEHSLAKVSLQRARWLLDSAERSQHVVLVVISSGLVDGLRHSVSRNDMTSLTPKMGNRRRSRSIDSINKARVKKLIGDSMDESQKQELKKAIETDENEQKALELKPLELKRQVNELAEPVTHRQSRSSLHGRPGYAPSIGSMHGSEYSLSSTVEAAAHRARTSICSSKGEGQPPKTTRKVKKLHIMKGGSGLGIHIIGGKGSKYGDGIFIRQLEEGGAAFNHGCLHPGDEILMVDGKSLVGLAHEEAVAVLRTTRKVVQLVIATDYNEGESVTSSLQSIPDHLVMKNGTNRQLLLYPLQQPSALGTYEAPIEPEMLQPLPLLNTYHDDDVMEMIPLKAETRSLSSGEMETEIDPPFTSNMEAVIELTRREEGEPLGFSISKSRGAIVVRSIDPHGLAHNEGRLQEGQLLLAVNNISLENKSKQEAVDILNGQKGEKVVLYVRQWIPSSIGKKQVVLHKPPGERLGLQLTAGDNRGSVKVKNIADGSPAHKSLNLSIGDTLVTINGANVSEMGVDIVRNLLSNYPPGDITLEVVTDDDSIIAAAPKTEHAFELSTDSMSLLATRPPITSAKPVDTLLLQESESSEDSSSRSSLDVLEQHHFIISQLPVAQFPPTDIEISGKLDLPLTEPEAMALESAGHPHPLPQGPPTPRSGRSTPPLSGHSTPPIYPDTSQCPPELVQLEFKLRNRARGGLGITIVAGENYKHKLTSYQDGVFVIRRITAGGVASRDSRLKVGDQLRSVNGLSLLNLSHAEVLQLINEAHKEMQLTVWRDPNPLASSSIASLGSWSNLSGSRSSLEMVGESPPSQGKSRQLFASASPIRNSPLAARFSYTAPHTPPTRELELPKRWSTGNSKQYQSDEASQKYSALALGDDRHSTLENLSDKAPLEFPDTLPPDWQGNALETHEGPPSEPPEVPPLEPPESPPLEPPEVPPLEPPESPPLEPLESPPLEPPEVPPLEPPELLEDTPPLKPADVPSLEPAEVPPLEPPLIPQVEPLEDYIEPPKVPALEPPEVPPEAPLVGPPEVPPLELQDVPSLELSDTSLPEIPGGIPPPHGSPVETPRTSPTPPGVSSPVEVYKSPVLESESPSLAVLHTSSDLDGKESLEGSTSKLPDSAELPKIAKTDGSQQDRPRSLKAPRGKRLGNSPFEIELNKGVLGIGAKLTTNAMGMMAIKSLTSRSVIQRDNNIRVGDTLLAINDDSVIGWSKTQAENALKSLSRGKFRLTVMAPPKDVTGSGVGSGPTPPPVLVPAQAPAPVLVSAQVPAPVLVPAQAPAPVNSSPTPSKIVEGNDASVHNEGVIEVILEGHPLGLVLEGGVDSDLQMIHIQSFIPNSPALQSCLFNVGDQLVMVGQACLVGKTLSEAKHVLDSAPSPVLVVAQRKISPKLPTARAHETPQISIITASSLSDIPSNANQPKLDATQPSEQVSIIAASSLPDIPSNANQYEVETVQPPEVVLTSATSIDSFPSQLRDEPHDLTVVSSSGLSQSHEGPINKADPIPVLIKTSSESQLPLYPTERSNPVSEEILTVKLQRGPGEKYGLKVAGGRDNPALDHVHVKVIVPDGVASREGTIRRGDRLISVNGQSVEDLTNKEALQLLKEAGDSMTLVLSRKIGRRLSRQTTPSTSTTHSQQTSRDVSRAESRRWSPQRSPRATKRGGGYGTGSSDEGSREGSRGPSPQATRRHRRRESVTVEGEVVTLRDRKSTLPRKLRGAKVGVHLVELHKGPTGLGMQVSGGVDGTTPITVKVVLKGGPADKSHAIHEGDQILEVNKTSFENFTQKQAMDFLRSLPQGKVSIILRDRHNVRS